MHTTLPLISDFCLVRGERASEVYQTFPDHYNGYPKLNTPSHGYLVVRKDDMNAEIAKNIVAYGYVTEKAYYLEEDSEAGQFIKAIN